MKSKIFVIMTSLVFIYAFGSNFYSVITNSGGTLIAFVLSCLFKFLLLFPIVCSWYFRVWLFIMFLVTTSGLYAGKYFLGINAFSILPYVIFDVFLYAALWIFLLVYMVKWFRTHRNQWRNPGEIQNG